MKLLLNLLWFVLAGFWLAVGYAVAAVLMCVTVIGIPFGIQAFKLARYSLWPFGRVVVHNPEANPALGCAGNALWFLPGVMLALGHVVTGVLLCATVIGIPLGVGNFKLVPLALFPFGKTIVRVEQLTQAMTVHVMITPTR